MENIIYKKEEAVARIMFNRPKSLNAFNEPMMRELKEALLDAEADKNIKVIVVSGVGRAFSAGVDIKATSADGFDKNSHLMRLGEEISDLFYTISKVTIAKVHGYCFTGALELMMFFDMAFCTENTQFGDTHAKWSIMPRWGMTQRLSRRVGLIKAKELTFRAMRVGGEEAERIGLVNRAFKAEELDSEVNKIVQEILGNSFEAIAAIKKLYNDGYSTTLKEGLALELEADTALGSTDDRLSGFKKTQ